MTGISIGVVDDQALVRAALRRLLEAEPDFVVAWDAQSGREAVRRYQERPVDVVVMDFVMPDEDGLETTAELRRHDPDARIVMVTHHSEADLAARALRAGALGFVPKGGEPAQLKEAILAAAAGRSFVPADLQAAVERYLADGDEPLAALSDRELQVLVRLARGTSNGEIASQLCISQRTVDSHRRRILQKLGLRNNSDLTRFALRQGLL